MSTQVSGGWSGFFGGLNELAVKAIDGYTQLELAEIKGRSERQPPVPAVQDRDPTVPQGSPVLFGGITQQQALIGFGALLAGAVLMKVLD